MPFSIVSASDTLNNNPLSTQGFPHSKQIIDNNIKKVKAEWSTAWLSIGLHMQELSRPATAIYKNCPKGLKLPGFTGYYAIVPALAASPIPGKEKT